MKNTRVDSLEHSLLELGSEVYQLKHRLAALGDQNDKMLQQLNSLKKILDDKGVISEDDFLLAVDSHEAPEMTSRVSDYEFPDLGDWKKKSH